MLWGNVYMIFLILFVGILIGMTITAIVIKTDEKIDRDLCAAKDKLIEEQRKSLRLLQARIILLTGGEEDDNEKTSV